MVVKGWLCYDLCEIIWAGLPTTKQPSLGLETTDVEQDHLQPTSSNDKFITNLQYLTVVWGEINKCIHKRAWQQYNLVIPLPSVRDSYWVTN